jgi:ketosteroid isomerase-like protein
LPVSDRLDALGPPAAESVKQLLKAILAQPQDLSAEFVAAGPVAWVAAEGAGQGKVGGQAIEFPLRATVVLEQRGDKWLFVQLHMSLPAPAQDEGDSVPV